MKKTWWIALTGPSPHLSWKELGCRDGTPYPARWRKSHAVILAREFEAIRTVCGHPLVVLSGYRTTSHNRKVGGARHSQHLEGRALDLRPPAGWTAIQLGAVVKGRAAEQSHIRGIGVYPGFVHIDVRDTERLVAWRGRRQQADRSDST